MQMTDCPNCKVGYSPSSRMCPLCQEFETPFEDHARYLAAQIVTRLDSGEPPDYVRSHLIASGLSDEQATDLVKRGRRLVAARIRGLGLKRTVVGVGMLLLGLAAIAALLVTGRLKPRFRRRPGVVGMLVIGGVLAVATGLYSIVPGRPDSRRRSCGIRRS